MKDANREASNILGTEQVSSINCTSSHAAAQFNSMEPYDDPEARDILSVESIKWALEQLRCTTPDSMPPPHRSIMAKSHMQLLRQRMLSIGDFVVAKTRNRPDRWEMELRLW
jgi:hypothetical protein